MMAMRGKPGRKAALVVALACLGGCREAGPRERERRIEDKTKELLQLQQKRQDRARELKSLSLERLVAELAADSQKQREPFNSPAFAEAVARGPAAGAELRPLLKDRDRRSFLGLLALRKGSPEQYRAVPADFRVAVLVNALESTKTFNVWGLPHAYWEEAARALIDEGPAAQAALAALLRDRRSAPSWGGEEVQEYQRYKYRVCDYAWVLLTAIRGKQAAIPESPEERDRLIAADPLFPRG